VHVFHTRKKPSSIWILDTNYWLVNLFLGSCLLLWCGFLSLSCCRFFGSFLGFSRGSLLSCCFFGSFFCRGRFLSFRCCSFLGFSRGCLLSFRCCRFFGSFLGFSRGSFLSFRCCGFLLGGSCLLWLGSNFSFFNYLLYNLFLDLFRKNLFYKLVTSLNFSEDTAGNSLLKC
jgi:hypothetical protein